MAYDEFTAKMVRKCSELEHDLAEKGAQLAKADEEIAYLNMRVDALLRDMEDEERRKDAVIEQQAQQIATLREALQSLYDVQNGCPLPKYQKDWDRAMELTQQALKEVKA